MFAHKTPWIVLLVLWMAGATWWHLCKIKQLCINDVSLMTATPTDSSQMTTPPGADGYSIADGNRFRLDLPGNFSFAKSGANANLNTLGGSLEPVVAYLKANPGRTLALTGYYAPTEKNSTTFPNLGLARAEGIKQYFVQQAIPAASISTKGEERILPFDSAKGDSLLGGLAFGFAGAVPTTVTPTSPAEPAVTTTPPAMITVAANTTENELAKAEKFKSIFEPIDLYFPLNEASYIKTDETGKFFSEATKYLAEHKDKKLLLTGHTDNSGGDEVNLRLSRDRANEVKARLRKSGIDSGQISVEAKGESQPKADNSTLAGRRANRRVTVVIVQ